MTEKIGCVQHDCVECVARLAHQGQDDRRLQIAMRQWEDWKTYALELQKKLVKYEGGSPMLLNAQPEERNFCPRCGKRLASGFVEISIHTCTPPTIDPNQWAFDRGLEST